MTQGAQPADGPEDVVEGTPRRAHRSRRLAPVVGVLTAVSLVAAGTWFLLAPAPDERSATRGPALENDERVLAELAPNGLPADARLLSTVTARGGERRVVEDPASTTNVRYLDRRGAPATGEGVVLVEVGGSGTTSVVTEATFDRPLPVAVHAEYRLDGQVVAPEDVTGESGDLTVRYTVTNTTAQPTAVRYEDSAGTVRTQQVPVFVPFSGTLSVTLPTSLELVGAPDAARATDEQGRTVLRFPLLLAPPLGSYQQDAVVTVRTTNGTTPEAVLDVVPIGSGVDPAAGFTADSLDAAADGNRGLTGGLRELEEQGGLLADGAAALAEGSDALASGAAVLDDQVRGPLATGAAELSAGADALAGGADDLADGLAAALPGANGVAEGARQLSAGLAELSAGLAQLVGPDGLPQAVASAGLLRDGAGRIADAVGSAQDGPWPPPGTIRWPPAQGATADLTLDELAALLEQGLPDLDDLPADVPPPTLVQSVRLLQQVADLLPQVSAALVASAQEQTSLLAQATAEATAASTGAQALAAEVCGPTGVLTPQQCAELDDVAARAQASAAATAQVATRQATQALLATGLAGGLGGLDAALDSLEAAVLELSVALRSGDPAAPGLVEGLGQLQEGLVAAQSATQTLQAGASAAAEAGAGLSAGTAALATGVGAAADGADSLAEGADQLAGGASAAVDGVGALADGTSELAVGARQAAGGSADVASGVDVLTRDGIGEVTRAVVAASQEPSLAAAWLAATDARVDDALPYGPPEGAVGHASYRLTMAATSSQATPAWQWWALGVGGLVVAGVAIRRRLTG